MVEPNRQIAVPCSARVTHNLLDDLGPVAAQGVPGRPRRPADVFRSNLRYAIKAMHVVINSAALT